MWPWESEPHSLAHGILDDETYDWRNIVKGMFASGGWPIVVSEDQVDRANQLARKTTGIDVDHTGSAGLAGLLALSEWRAKEHGTTPLVSPTKHVAVIFRCPTALTVTFCLSSIEHRQTCRRAQPFRGLESDEPVMQMRRNAERGQLAAHRARVLPHRLGLRVVLVIDFTADSIRIRAVIGVRRKPS